MADDPAIGDPGGSGFTLPDAPGDFSETTPNELAAQPGKRANPFTPLTPAQERDERARLNFQSANRSTLYGSVTAADTARMANAAPSADGQSPAEQAATYDSNLQSALQTTGAELSTDLTGGIANFDEAQNSAKDRLAKMQADQLAYENMPAYKGVAEGLYSLAGQVSGGMASPENLIFPEVKLGSVAWRAAHPLIADIIGYGVGQAAIQGASNPIVQSNQIKAGLRKEFDPVEMSLAAPIGFAFGGGLTALHAGGAALYRYTADAIQKWALDGVMRGPTLTPEVKPPVGPEVPKAPADTFDYGAQQVPGAPAAPSATSGALPPLQPGTTRLYRAAGAGDETAKHVLFAQEQFPGANEFIDVPDNVAMERAHGDRVSLPADYAAVRQKLPEGEVGVAPKDTGPSVFENLTDYSKLAQGSSKEPQSFTQWVRSQGGLKPDPELNAIYGRTKADLVRKNGKTLDEIREAAVEQGWIPDQGKETGGVATSTTEDVLKRLADEDKGVKHFHPGEEAKAQAAAAKSDPKLTQAMSEVDTSLREIGEHPDQVQGKARKSEQKDIRNRAIEIVYTEDVHPDVAVERAMTEYGEHAYAAQGQSGRLVEGQPDVPFDTSAASGAGGRAGEAGAGPRGAGAEPPLTGGAHAPSAAEGRIAKRLKGMAGQGVAVAPGQTRPGAGVASANVGANITPLENLQQMMRRISSKLELIVRKGVHEKGALGQYDFETHIVRIKDMGPDGVATWAHEVGHDVENRMGKPVRDLTGGNMQSMKAFAGVMGEGLEGPELAREGFGEFMAGYITNRAILERKDPAFVEKFRMMMAKENPELLATLDDAAASFERYNAAPSGQAVDSMIVTHGEIPKPDPNDPLKRGPLQQWLGEMYFRYVNKQHPITIAVRYLAKEFEKKNGKLLDLRPDEDPKVLAQVLSDSGFQKTVMDLTYGIQNMRDLKPEGPSYFSILRRVTADPLTGQEVGSPQEFLMRRQVMGRLSRSEMASRSTQANVERRD